MRGASLRLCIVDMTGDPASAPMRCLRALVMKFFEDVRRRNPSLTCDRVEVAPRVSSDVVPRDCDLYISTGGPGSPFQDDGSGWAEDHRHLYDAVVESAIRADADRQAMFAICYSFERIVRHFELAQLEQRPMRQFGVMPIFTTARGREHPLLAEFDDCLHAVEHRSWQAVDLDERRMGALGGSLLARERSHDGALLAFHIASGIEAVQFHPEADPTEVMHWLSSPDHASVLKATHGDSGYRDMLRAATHPRGLARTHARVIPGWLARAFNAMAEGRGYRALDGPR